jgi:hypothetical protein
MDDIKAPSPAELFKNKKKGSEMRNHPDKGKKSHPTPKRREQEQKRERPTKPPRTEDVSKGDFEGLMRAFDRSSKFQDQTKQLKSAYDDGFEKGREAGHKDLLDFLQNRFLSKRGPDRGSPEADALLKLAAEAARYFRGEPVKGPLGDNR